MGITGILILAVSVALDALAVSFSGAFIDREHPWKHAVCAGFAFGGFQFLMPLIGYFIGISVMDFIGNWGHCIAFSLLTLTGGKMIIDVLKNDNGNINSAPFHFPAIIILAVATSIDALSVGASFAMIKNPILIPAVTMGVVTMFISMTGVMLGSIGAKIAAPEKILGSVGGLAVILIGFKILIENSLN